MTEKEVRLYALFTEIRACFNRLRTLADDLHADIGVNPSMRAVMEVLNGSGKMTVPEIARQRGVSRQHVQTVMNSLESEGYVEPFDNPAHRRSPLFGLTAAGKSVFEEMARREVVPLQRLAAAIPEETIARAETSLRDIGRLLEREISADRS